MTGYTAAVLVLGCGLIVLKLVVGWITATGHEVPWPLWAYGGVTHTMLGFVLIRNGGKLNDRTRNMVKDLIGLSEGEKTNAAKQDKEK
jgi:hypothetical protein